MSFQEGSGGIKSMPYNIISRKSTPEIIKFCKQVGKLNYCRYCQVPFNINLCYHYVAIIFIFIFYRWLRKRKKRQESEYEIRLGWIRGLKG